MTHTIRVAVKRVLHINILSIVIKLGLAQLSIYFIIIFLINEAVMYDYHWESIKNTHTGTRHVDPTESQLENEKKK